MPLIKPGNTCKRNKPSDTEVTWFVYQKARLISHSIAYKKTYLLSFILADLIKGKAWKCTKQLNDT